MLKRADQFPFHCPQCGDYRQVEVVESSSAPILPGISIYVDAFGETVFPQSLPVVTRTEVDTEFCLRCGFRWKSLLNPTAALSAKLAGFSDLDLLTVIKFFYPSFKNLITEVASSLGKSISHVQRVVTGEPDERTGKSRKSATVDAELVKRFRERLQASGIDKLV